MATGVPVTPLETFFKASNLQQVTKKQHGSLVGTLILTHCDPPPALENPGYAPENFFFFNFYPV